MSGPHYINLMVLKQPRLFWCRIFIYSRAKKKATRRQRACISKVCNRWKALAVYLHLQSIVGRVRVDGASAGAELTGPRATSIGVGGTVVASMRRNGVQKPRRAGVWRRPKAADLEWPVEPRQRDRDAHVADDDHRRRNNQGDDCVGVVDCRHQVVIQRLRAYNVQRSSSSLSFRSAATTKRRITIVHG